MLESVNRERGNYATGIMYCLKDCFDGEYLYIDGRYKNQKIYKVQGVFDFNKNKLPENEEIVYLGHNQAPTSSEREFSYNTSHPFYIGDWIVAHNGVLTNFKEIKKAFFPWWSINVDSSVIPALMAEYDNQSGPADTELKEVKSILFALRILEGTFGLWIVHAGSNNIYVARQGSTLYHKGTDVSSIKGDGYEEVPEGKLFKYTDEGLKEVGTFKNKSPFLTL